MAKRNLCWAKLEKFNQEKIPACVKSLLVASGYSTLFSLSTLSKDKIEEIESYVNKNPKYIETLHCCFNEEYRAQQKFEFLPGHKSVILNLPCQIEKMKNTCTRARDDNEQPKKKTKKNSSKAISEEDSKIRLIKNLLSFTAKNGIETDEPLISAINLQDFKSGPEGGNYQYSCSFSCPFCERSIPLKFTTFWGSSNVTTHLKDHFNAVELVANE